jgi:light-regulated signal transduction histidine kinase (bacteriophytochrome)
MISKSPCGIANYVQFLLEDYTGALGEEGRQGLATIRHLTQRMESLLDALLHYSHTGRMGLHLTQVDLDDVLARSLDLIHAQLAESDAALRVLGPLGIVRGDLERLTEVFTNLLTNALQYNDKPEKWIEIGVQPRADDAVPVFYVRDNGIGIVPNHQEKIFEIFRRLHPRDAFGGGTGTGLTVVKKIIERHGGWI